MEHEAYTDHHHLMVALARQKGHPLYFLRCTSGTTLDCFTSELEARNARLCRKTPTELWIQRPAGTLERLAGVAAKFRMGLTQQ